MKIPFIVIFCLDPRVLKRIHNMANMWPHFTNR